MVLIQVSAQGDFSRGEPGVIREGQAGHLVCLLPAAVVGGAGHNVLVQVGVGVLGGVLLGRGPAEGVLQLVGGGVAVHGQLGAHAIDGGHGELGALQFQLEPALLSLGVTAQVAFAVQLHWQGLL